ncbi:LysR family transcriptional regulator [Natronospirillum operosum]|uniref:LysR family transcriptional regulator n=1 Tax=Natronospirillum operosum TaxID=2759953 RepID=A0A4Z0WAV0_9GAMM|nr:LysR family transcriptional regulator [Natronospirillum operosum]TGG92861.1 LysR family transcriptional regulator [Natronospirillum operosum]
MSSLVDLDYFLAVADTGSLTRASERCGISVPAMSKAMRRLENSLDARLLARSSQSIRLTESGQLLAARARVIRQEWVLGKQELAQFQQVPAGRVSISASAGFARTLLLPLLSGFRARYPEVVLDLQLDDHIADLSSVDLSIRVGLVEEQGVIARPLLPLGMQYGASKEFLSRYQKPDQPEDLHQLPVIGFRLPSSGRLMPWQFQRESEIFTLDIKPVVIVNEPQAILDLIRAGVGVGLINAYMSELFVMSGELETLLTAYLPPSERGIYLCYQSREHMPLKQRVVIDFLMEKLGAPLSGRGIA